MFLFKDASEQDNDVSHKKKLFMDKIVQMIQEQRIKTRAELLASGILKTASELSSSVKHSKKEAAQELNNLRLQITLPKCYAYKRIFDGLIA
jgi:hypothetical protein